MTDKGAQARLDSTQLAVAFLAYFVGGWALVFVIVLMMFIWAFLTRLFVLLLK